MKPNNDLQIGRPPAHDREKEATVDPIMALTLIDAGVDAVVLEYAVEVLLICMAIRAKH